MVPDYWTSKPLGELVSISKGKKVATQDTWEQNSIPYIGANAFTGNFTVFTSSENAVVCRQDDILILWDGERSGLAAIGLHGAVGSTVARLCSKSDVNPRFLYYFMDSKFKWIQERRTGLAIPHVPKDLKDLLIIDLPPLSEQNKIAAILSSVDDTIHATQAVIDQTRTVKQGLLQQLLTRGIGHTRFKQTEIGEIPEDWDVVHLSEIASHERSSFANGPFGSNLLKSDLRTTGVPVIYIRDIKNAIYNPVKHVYVDKNKADELSSCEVLPGDILITKVGDPPGIASIYPEGYERAIVTQDVIRLRINSEKCQPEFVRIVINSPLGCTLIENISIEGTRKRMALGTFKKIRFPLPTLPEQEQITKVITLTESTIIEEQQKIESLNKIKRGLMQDLLTGRVRVKLDEMNTT